MNRKFRKDHASATLVTGIISVMFLVLCMGLAFDVTKNVKLKTDQTSNAQRAVQTAIKTIDSRGSLTANAPKSVVTEYLRQSGASTYANQAVGSGVHYDENQTYKSGAVCKQRNINLTGGSTINARMPYMVIQIDSERKLGTASNSIVYTSEGGADPVLKSGAFNPALRYKVISVEVYDSVNNFVLNMFQIPCQNLRSSVSAIAFGTQEDIA